MINKPKKLSPYAEFKNWLLNSYTNERLPEYIIKIINPRVALSMFGKLNNITIFLNLYFNNYGVMSLQNEEFCYFLKSLVQRFRLNRYDFSFFATMKKNKSLKELQQKLPYLKKYEIDNLLQISKEDDRYNSFLENLGLHKYKKVKIKKSKTTKNSKQKNTSLDVGLINIKTFNDWRKFFNV